MKLTDYGLWTAINVVVPNKNRKFVKVKGHPTQAELIALEPNAQAYQYIKHGKRFGESHVIFGSEAWK